MTTANYGLAFVAVLGLTACRTVPSPRVPPSPPMPVVPERVSGPRPPFVPVSRAKVKALELASPERFAEPRWLPPEWTTNSVILLDDPNYLRSHCAWHLWNDGSVSHVTLPGSSYDRPELGGYQTGIQSMWDFRTNANALIGIIDQLPDFTHPDLSYIQAVTTNCNPSGGGIASRTTDHGTRVAGVIGARWGNGYAAGVAQVDRMAAAGFNWGEVQAVEAIFWCAAQGAEVINCSWGFANVGEPLGLKAAIEAHPDILFVCAVINDEIDLDANPVDYPTCWGLSNVLSVGYYDRGGNHFWSGYGTKVDLEAPGRSIFMPGVRTGYTPDWQRAVTNTFGYGGGSSYAAAVVTACAALVMDEYACGPLAAKQILLAHREGPNKRLQCAHLLDDAHGRPKLAAKRSGVVEAAGSTDGWRWQRSYDLKTWENVEKAMPDGRACFFRMVKQLNETR